MRADHQAFKYTLIMPGVSGQLAWWYLRLSNCEMDIAHPARIHYQAVGALFELPTAEPESTTLDDDVYVLDTTRETSKIDYNVEIKRKKKITGLNKRKKRFDWSFSEISVLLEKSKIRKRQNGPA